MTPREYLKLCGEMTGMSKAQIKVKSDELLALVRLADVNRKIGGFQGDEATTWYCTSFTK